MIDPSIALQIRPPQLNDPFEVMSKVLALRQLQQEAPLRQQRAQQEIRQNQLAIEQAERERAEYDAFKQGVGAGKTPKELMGVSPTRAIAFSKAQFDARKSELDVAEQELKNRSAAAQRLGSLAGAATDQPSYESVIMQAVREGLIPKEALSQIPAAYDPNVVRQFAMQAMTASQQHEAALKDLQEKRAAEKEKRDIEEHEAKMPGIQAQTQKAQQEAAGTQPITPYQREQLDRQKVPNTPAELAAVAADPSRTPEVRANADAALKRLNEYQKAGRPVTHVSGGSSSGGGDTPKIIAKEIAEGRQPPDLKGLYGKGASVRAELGRLGYDLVGAQRDWQAVQKHISTLNGPQQERLRQAVTFTYDSLDVIEGLFDEWKKLGKATGIPMLNKVNLKLAKNLPGRAGEVAVALEAQINDLTSELGTVYKGGNSSTDESLRLAGENLKANWNSEQFKRQLENIRKNLQIRKNSILNSAPMGVSENSPYVPKPAAGAAPKAKADPLGIR